MARIFRRICRVGSGVSVKRRTEQPCEPRAGQRHLLLRDAVGVRLIGVGQGKWPDALADRPRVSELLCQRHMDEVPVVMDLTIGVAPPPRLRHWRSSPSRNRRGALCYRPRARHERRDRRKGTALGQVAEKLARMQQRCELANILFCSFRSYWGSRYSPKIALESSRAFDARKRIARLGISTRLSAYLRVALAA